MKMLGAAFFLALFFAAATAAATGPPPVFQAFRARVAVDYGPRAVGVATSDPFGNVQPVCTLENTGDMCALSHRILDVTRSSGALEVIVGLPLDSNGKMGPRGPRNFNGQLCMNFSKVLSAVTVATLPRVKVLLFDERYTTREAKARLRLEKVRASLDAMSAACLLERYLEDSGVGAMPAEPCSYPPPADLAFFDYDVVRAHIREQYFSDPPSPGRREALIMQSLKAGKTAREVRRIFGPAASRASTAMDEEEEEAEAEGVGRRADDGRPAARTPVPDVITAASTDAGDAEVCEAAAPLSAADLELLEYQRIKAAKRKRGTLKRLHKKPDTATIGEGEGEGGIGPT